MSLADVKKDYAQERTMLETWRNRMDIPTEVTDVPPESQMSIEYRQGWKTYLHWVLAISERMISMCAAAEVSGSTVALSSTLLDEANKYGELAAAADDKGLTELKEMLTWEATSRREVAASLGPIPAGAKAGVKKKGAKKKAAKKKAASKK